MSSYSDVSINNNTWTEIAASTASECLIQARNDIPEGVVYRFGTSAPDATVVTGHDLLPGHPVRLTMFDSDNLYAKCLNTATGTVKVTTT